MKTNQFIGVVELLSVVFTTTLSAQPSAVTYQGRLTDNGSPANGSYDLRFAIYGLDTGGFEVGGPITNSAMVVSNGLFSVTLDFGPGVFDGSDRWLEIGAVSNGGSAFTALSPRQPIGSTPYAIQAANAMSVDLGSISNPSFIGTTSSNAPLDFFVNNQRGLRLEHATGDGYESVNLIGGFSGNSVGSMTEGAVIAGGGRSAGLANSIGSDSDLSVIGGGGHNNIASNAVAATIAGGWFNDIGVFGLWGSIGGGYNNIIMDYSLYATIAGGQNNYIDNTSHASGIGGGEDNHIASASSGATISGGENNAIGTNSDHSTIGGGVDNNILSNSFAATIAGGYFNTIGVNANNSTIGGGTNNNIGSGAAQATIPGGSANAIGSGADYAFAAGRQAKAYHQGAFVWADSTPANFVSTASDQFLIRASGGVGIGTTSPTSALDVNGIATATSFSGSGSGLTALNASQMTSGTLSDSRLSANVAKLDVSQTFTGTLGIRLNAADRPMITRAWDPFTSGPYVGAGRWGLFMETSHLTIGMPAVGGRYVDVAKYNADGTSTVLLTVDQSGNLFTTGAVNPPSDRHVKHDFQPVSAQAVLEQVVNLPLHTWSYTNDASGHRHLGPVAQDFHAAFGLGTDERHIATVDADGVALAAIQGLNQELESRSQQAETSIRELKAENAGLKARIERLEGLLNSLTRQLAN